MASKSLIRQTTSLIASRFITSQAPRLLKYQTIKNCIYPSSSLLHQSQSFSNSSRLLTGAFECINIQDSDDFKNKVLQSTTPVVVDFHATWCGPCKILAPRLEAIISEKKGKVLMAKVDIDENSDLAMEYEVRSVPMVVSIKNGKIQDSFIGVKDDDILEDFVEKLL